ncbi:MAG: NAD(P)-dependent oxidoreductase [Pseudomonadota bacterium]
MADKTFLVTGAMGCIGAWVLRHLLDRGQRVVASDLGTEPVRPRLLMSEDELANIKWAQLDVTDTAAVSDLVARESVTHIIHLAGLQIPFCKANPALGASVNVTGTINIFEAARAHGVKGLSYASSLGVLGPASDYDQWPLPDDALPNPGTLYGVYKVANEGTARVYAQDWGIGSVGLRPYTVYGVGRDQGLTADCAKAILAAAAGRPFHIRFGGEIALQHASDVAEIFLASAEAETKDAYVLNLRGDVVSVEAYIQTLRSVVPDAAITCSDTPLPFPADLSDAGLQTLLGTVPATPLQKAITADVMRYRALLSENRIDLAQLDL